MAMVTTVEANAIARTIGKAQNARSTPRNVSFPIVTDMEIAEKEFVCVIGDGLDNHAMNVRHKLNNFTKLIFDYIAKAFTDCLENVVRLDS